MPRPKLHNTAEEKQKAIRQKHAKYYQKHKAEIQLKRAEKKWKQQQKGSQKRSKRGKKPAGQGESSETRYLSNGDGNQTDLLRPPRPKLVLPEQPSVLAARRWEGKAEKIAEKISKVYGGHESHHGYCDTLYHRYITQYQEPAGPDDNAFVEPFEQAYSVMEGYTGLLRKYKLKLLEEVGQEDGYWRVDRMEKKAFVATSAISDLLCEAYLGLEHVEKMYNRRKFPFQNGGKASTS